MIREVNAESDKDIHQEDQVELEQLRKLLGKYQFDEKY